MDWFPQLPIKFLPHGTGVHFCILHIMLLFSLSFASTVQDKKWNIYLFYFICECTVFIAPLSLSPEYSMNFAASLPDTPILFRFNTSPLAATGIVHQVTLDILLGHFCIGCKDVGLVKNRARIFKRLWSPGIDCKEWIPPAYVAWRAGTITLFLLGS